MEENKINLMIAENERAQKEEIMRLQQDADLLARKGGGNRNVEFDMADPGNQGLNQVSNRSSQKNMGILDKGTENIMSDRD